MGQAISSRAAARGADLGRDTTALVAKHLDPWSRGRCACISRTWKRAIQEVSSSPDASNQHWLVAGEGNRNSLSMCNVVTGYKKVVKPDLPWASIPTDPEHADDDNDDDRSLQSRAWRVLCSFQGLVLISLGCMHEHTLVLGDPLLNKWIKLPAPEWPRQFSFLSVAAFCAATNTIIVTTNGARCTATFGFAAMEWVVDPCQHGDPKVVFDPVGHACCLGGVFYCTFVYYPFETRGRDDPHCGIACYDPVNDRQWQIVRGFYLDGDCFLPVFLAEQSQDKMLVYMVPDTDGSDDDDFELFEASKSQGSNELEIVPCPLMDDESIGKKIKLSLDLVDRAPPCKLRAIFHGKGDMFFWDTFYVDKVLVLSLQQGQGIVKELEGMRNNCIFPYSRCYYTPAPGTRELLQNLAAKLQDQHNVRT